MQIYDCPENELKLNDVYEFIGVLTLTHDVTMDKHDNNEFSNDFFEEELVHSLPDKVFTTDLNTSTLSHLMSKRFLTVIL